MTETRESYEVDVVMAPWLEFLPPEPPDDECIDRATQLLIRWRQIWLADMETPGPYTSQALIDIEDRMCAFVDALVQGDRDEVQAHLDLP